MPVKNLMKRFINLHELVVLKYEHFEGVRIIEFFSLCYKTFNDRHQNPMAFIFFNIIKLFVE